MGFDIKPGMDLYYVVTRKTKERPSDMIRTVFGFAYSPEDAIQHVIETDKEKGIFNPENGYHALLFGVVTHWMAVPVPRKQGMYGRGE